jgi:hypothetical protein
MTFKEKIKASFKFIFRNFLWLLLLGLYFSIPSYFGEHYIVDKNIKIVFSVFGGFLDILFMGIVTTASLAYFSGEKVSWRQSIIKVFNKLPALIGLSILEIFLLVALVAILSPIFLLLWLIESHALIFLLGFLTICAAFIGWCYLFFSKPALMFDNLSPLESIKQSYRLSEKCLFQILGYLVFATIIFGVPSAIFSKLFPVYYVMFIKVMLKPFVMILPVLGSLCYLNLRGTEESHSPTLPQKISL